MKLEAVLRILGEHQPEFQQYGVNSLAIFGSVARGTANDASDVDILVEFNQPVGLFEFARLKLRLEKLLQHSVDLATLEALRPELRETILKEAVHGA
jgi:predicted nucleotidyltransferase